MLRREMRVPLHHRQRAVTQQLLQLVQGHSPLDRPRRERMGRSCQWSPGNFARVTALSHAVR